MFAASEPKTWADVALAAVIFLGCSVPMLVVTAEFWMPHVADLIRAIRGKGKR